jgi:hypothetical protein
MSLEPAGSSRSGRRAAAWGVITLIAGALLALSPLVLGNGVLIKYIMATGFLGVCLGTSFTIHGLWDLWRGRRR